MTNEKSSDQSFEIADGQHSMEGSSSIRSSAAVGSAGDGNSSSDGDDESHSSNSSSSSSSEGESATSEAMQLQQPANSQRAEQPRFSEVNKCTDFEYYAI